MYEVEVKCPLDETEPVLARLKELQAAENVPVAQRDLYLAHPARDFAQTDEALRLRQIGDRNRLTYKGPIVDAQTKTRREIEIELASGPTAADGLCEIFFALGFRPVRSVSKTRVVYALCWEDREVELALDTVEDLGTFLEIECQADESHRDAVRDSILRLAAHLGLEKFERKSYLCLLIEKDAAANLPASGLPD